MSESKTWKKIKNSFKIPGKLERIEVKGKSGFADVLGLVRHVMLVWELKYVPGNWEDCKLSKFPYKLIGPQAVNLQKWQNVGAMSLFIVEFKDGVKIWKAEKSIRMIVDREDIKSKILPIPPPDYEVQMKDFWHLISSLLQIYRDQNNKNDLHS